MLLEQFSNERHIQHLVFTFKYTNFPCLRDNPDLSVNLNLSLTQLLNHCFTNFNEPKLVS